MGDEKTEFNSRSPWAAEFHNNAEAEIHPPLQPPDGVIAVSGSKSYTNRAVIIAALAEGSSTLRDILRSDDSYWCLDALKKLGAAHEVTGNTVRIKGTGGEWPLTSGRLYIGAAGTIARFLPGALAAAGKGSWTLAGNRRLSERPVRPLIEALNTLGANIRYTDGDGQLPVHIEARGLAGGHVTVSGAVSSQFISGLLIASPYARQKTVITVEDGLVQHAYVGMTIELMKRFGVSVEHDGAYDRFTVEPQRYQGQDVQLEADASTAGYFLAYAALTGGRIRITNLTAATLQPDIGLLKVLERMGCRVTGRGGAVGNSASGLSSGKVEGDGVVRFASGRAGVSRSAEAGLSGGKIEDDREAPIAAGKTVAGVRTGDSLADGLPDSTGWIELIGPEKLRGGFTVSMREMSDQTLTVAVLALFADAPVTVTDVEHIRTHECDRIRAMCDSLTRLGIQVEEHRDGLTVHPGMPQPTAALDTYDDHRMAMSLALIGSRVAGIRLRDPGCVSKTCPAFFEEMQKLGLRVTFD